MTAIQKTLRPTPPMTDPTPDIMLNSTQIRTRFQTIISMREQAVIGLEALSYGIETATGLRIRPDLLFARARADGFTLELDRRCREGALSSFQGLFPERKDRLLFLNLETSILLEGVVGTGRLLESVRRYGLSPRDIVIEIVESKSPDLQALKDFVDLYRGHGFFIALDDVGTGHSNLERIAQIKPDIIKIDRGLIQGLHQEHYKHQVVRALTNLAQSIGALAVAEGIETEQEALAVMDLGINLHQGYFYAHPDEPIPDQLGNAPEKMARLAQRFRAKRLAGFSQKQIYYETLGNSIQTISDRLADLNEAPFEPILTQCLDEELSLECLYVLNQKGVQISETVCNPAKLLRPESPLFRPTSPGTDLSLKDYYLLIMAGLPRYVSDPYISRASGNICVTISMPFSTRNGSRFVLCADYDCEAVGARCFNLPVANP